MSASLVAPRSEMAILRRIVEPDQPFFSADAALAIMKLEFSREDRNRMNKLAERNRRGKLTVVEAEEFDNYIRVGQTLGVLQSKARRSLKAAGHLRHRAK